MKVQCGGKVAGATPAAGVRGVLCRSIDGEYFFRVYAKGGRFKDYELRHSDLTVTIAKDEEATFYHIGDNAILDHSPKTLGLKKCANGKKRYDARAKK